MSKRVPVDEELDITPMIDVTFLMLIFFMVASTMQGTPDLPIPPAKSGGGVDQASATVITVLNEGGEAIVLLGDGPRAPQGDVSSIASYVEQGVSEQRRNVILKADRDLPAGYIEEIAKAANVEGVEAMFYGVQEPD